MTRLLLVLLFSLFSLNSYSLIELNGEYGYDRQVYGASRQNDIVEKSYSGAVALYLFDFTAIELNYSESETVTEENNTISITDTTVDLIKSEQRVLVYSFGIGIRQALAPRGARLRPTLSLGYARQFIRDQTEYTFKNRSSGSTFTLREDPTKLRSDSVFATFGLELKLTKTFALRGSVKTVFPAFETDKARDNVKYLVGFTWYL